MPKSHMNSLLHIGQIQDAVLAVTLGAILKVLLEKLLSRENLEI